MSLPPALYRPYLWLTKRVARSWLLKCLVIGAVGSAIDYSLVMLLVLGFAVAAPAATLVGVLAGGTFNFLGNRALAFNERRPERVLRQALRFVAMLLFLSVLHTLAIWGLQGHLEVPLVPAKIACDVALFGLAQPVLLRWVVFPRVSVPRRTTQELALARIA
jgi:putative flippase GtrA